MDAKLAAPMIVEFNGASMKELYRWLQDEQKLSLSIDAAAMKEKGILSSELVTEKLDNEPLYLLLDRLKSLGIGWHFEGGDLFLTTTDAANHQMSSVSYNLGELLDSLSQLLENYRIALRESKPRKSTGPDLKELVTYYYRLPTEMAKDLQVNLCVPFSVSSVPVTMDFLSCREDFHSAATHVDSYLQVMR
jgi:hypothetical protein